MTVSEAERILEDAVLVATYQLDPDLPISLKAIVAKLRAGHPETSFETLERQVMFAVLRLQERGLLTTSQGGASA